MNRAAPVLLAALAALGANQALAAPNTVTIPSDTVVRLKLEDHLTSRSARMGDKFAAVMGSDDRSGFPEGTRFQGVVTEVQRYSKNRPGTMNVEIRRAYFPDGASAAVRGSLASLDEDSVRRTSDGRLESRHGGKKMDWKWAGYGAAGGAVLGGILGGGGGGLLKGAVLGGLGGAAYSYLNKDKTKGNFRDVDLPRGTEFGMRLDQRVAFVDRHGYNFSNRVVRNDDRLNDRSVDRATDRRADDERVLGNRQEGRSDSTVVRVNGRAIRFTDDKPLQRRGVLYVPLAPIADEANMRFDQRRGEDSFTLSTPSGMADGRAGDTRVLMGDRDAVTLSQEPLSINGVIYVSADFLRRVAGMRADYDSRNMTLNLETR
jgi:hypothetical protein